MQSRRGPELPYSIIAGVTPCSSGWLVASAKLHGATFAPEDPRVLETFTSVLDERPAFAVITLNAPIGCLEAPQKGGRTCDRLARAMLGPRRGSTIHSGPTRRCLEGDIDASDDHLDAVSTKLLPRYREVAAEMAPYLQRMVYEVHPDMSFYQLNGDLPLNWSKRTEAGRSERRVLLEKRIPGVERILDTRLPGVPRGHLYDVAALLWTARRIQARAALRVPIDPEWDEQGLRMELLR
jgi:predicted RNase H-like nuclease